ncbi:MAG: hypothetical protein M3O35_03770 [Acidobacteriota bacterium]|nr:hypothetical protein [Acidobacteriota bacterium]
MQLSKAGSAAISQRELRSLLSTQRCFEDMLGVLAGSAAVEPGPLGVDPVALRMRMPQVVIERDRPAAQPCRVAHASKPATAIAQDDLRTLQAAERLLVVIRERLLQRVRAGLPVEPGPLTLDVGVVQEPVFSSVQLRTTG